MIDFERQILLDTSFLIRLLNSHDELHSNALKYFKEFLKRDVTLRISTVSIAEYCVRGRYDELPMRNLMVLPFNQDHAIRAGKFARSVFEKREQLEIESRLVIPNDTKLFAQAAVESAIGSFATSDENCISIYRHLQDKVGAEFSIINIRNSISSESDELPFGE